MTHKIIGNGKACSATTGAKMVNTLATTLQYPNTVLDKIVGIRETLAKYIMLKDEDIPNLAIVM